MTMELEGNAGRWNGRPRGAGCRSLPSSSRWSQLCCWTAWFIRVYIAPATDRLFQIRSVIAAPSRRQSHPPSSVRAQAEAPRPPTVTGEGRARANHAGAAHGSKPPPRWRCSRRCAASAVSAVGSAYHRAYRRMPVQRRLTPERSIDQWRREPEATEAGRADRPVLFRCRGRSRRCRVALSPAAVPLPRPRPTEIAAPHGTHPGDRNATDRTVQFRLFHRVAGLDPHRRKAIGRERRQDLLGMRGVARLDRDVEPRALGRHVEEQPPVIDFEDIGAELAERGRDLARARPAGRGWSGGTTRSGPRARARAP